MAAQKHNRSWRTVTRTHEHRSNILQRVAYMTIMSELELELSQDLISKLNTERQS